MRDPLTIPSGLHLFRRMLLCSSPFGAMLFKNEFLYTTALANRF